MANNTNWLNITPMSGGTGETSLSLTALTNSSLSAKTATITAKNTTYNVQDTTTVTIQGFVPTLTLSRSTLRFDSTGGTATFTVYSNTAWTISYPELVHSYSTSAGTGDTEVTVVLAPNPDEVAKIDTGIVKDTYNINQLYLTIVQESFIVQLEVVPDDDIEFINTGGTAAITITSNADWDLDYPSWITPSVISGGSGTTIVGLTAGRNGTTDRSGTVTVYAGSKYVTINVYQPFYIDPYITVNPSTYTFPYSASTALFAVDSYPGWNAEIISTGETHWGEDIVMTVTMEVAQPATVNLGQAGVIVNGVVVPGSSYRFPSSGTYIVQYPYVSTTAPVLSGNTFITDVDIIDIIETIPGNGFNGCTNLSSITISDTVTSFGSYCFYNCTSLSSITIPSAVTNIGEASLGECTSLQEIVFPDSITGYGKTFLGNCSSLTSVTLGDGMTTIPSNAFAGCSSLERLDIPSGVSAVDAYAFNVCSSLKNINVYSEIAPTVVSNSFIRIASGGTLHYLAGSDYSSWLSTSSHYLGYYGWTGDPTLPPPRLSVTPDTIQNSVNSGTTQIKIVSPLPWTITSNESWVTFSQMTGASGATFVDVIIAANQWTALGEAYPRTATVTVTNGINSETVTVSQSGGTRIVVSYNVTSTSDNMQLTYAAADVFNKATLVDGTVIPKDAYHSWDRPYKYSFPSTGVQTVYFYLNDDVTTLTNDTFREITTITAVKVPGTISKLDYQVFWGCSSLSSVVLGNGIRTIGGRCFQDTSIRNIVIPNSVTVINNSCFCNCIGLTSVTLSENLELLGPGIFDGCTSLPSIVIPSGVTDIGYQCFDDCTSLSSITICGSTQFADNQYHCFCGCTSLSEIRCITSIPPTIFFSTFAGLNSRGGILYYPPGSGSNYSSWLSTSSYYLGYYGWTGAEL